MNQKMLLAKIEPILKQIKQLCVAERVPLTGLRFAPCGYYNWGNVPPEDAGWQPFLPGDAVGGQEAHFYFEGTVALPPRFAGRPAACVVGTGATDLWNNNNPQLLAYVNGKLACGLDMNHQQVFLTENAAGTESYTLGLNLYCNTPRRDIFLTVEAVSLVPEMQALYYDLKVPFDIYALLEEDTAPALELQAALENAVNRLDLRNVESGAFLESAKAARELLAQSVYGSLAGRSFATEYCVGHTHIDVAWLWSLAQTREKTVRSFASAIRLLEQYPEHRFMSSQPQLYDFVKQDCPPLYEKIGEMVRQGRWEAEGGMWVEADCNLTCGESLVRQFLYGKQFFKEEFGKENRILWLPDVFGYAAALPQIMKKCGVDYFMTTKIAWNDTNQIPNDTMLWQGIDGTEVLTHFISTADYVKNPAKNPNPSFNTTYNGLLSAKQVMGCWQRYQNKALSRDVLQCFGYGDGGGGPTAEMLEMQHRLQKGLPGAPATKISFAAEFFEKLAQNAQQGNTPKWVGELYLEYHRGTYTSMARNKKYNRLAEFANMESELWCALAAYTGAENGYPQQTLDEVWKLTLLNQFHDILPGSSIEQVYIDSKAQYEQVLQKNGEMQQKALAAIGGQVGAGQKGTLVFNPLGFARTERVQAAGQPFLAADIPPKGWKFYPAAEAEAQPAKAFGTVTADGRLVETNFYRLQMNEAGQVTSLFDKEERREIIKAGKAGNALQLLEDRPKDYDAWNVEAYAQDKLWQLDTPADISVVEASGTRIVVRIARTIENSPMVQHMVLYPHTRRIDFETEIDWKEQHLLLKVAFPVDVMANRAQYEIQFGNVARDTHRNTSWDAARFEVCAQKWADLSEAGYGVALLNNCKYGYDICDGVMRLSLLRAPVHPNPNADRERHTFTYSLLPHKGDWRRGGVIEEAYKLNCPVQSIALEARQGGSLPAQFSLCRVEGTGIVLETVKQAQSGDGSLVLRAYEAHGARTTAKLHLPPKAARLCECDMLESNDGPALEILQQAAQLTFKPYEIKTLHLFFV
ncbi:MAG: alpha-mannosidase [Oscillospiraceae bacterium]